MNFGPFFPGRRAVESIASAALICLWVTTASATLVESYAYRYSGIALVLFGLIRYLPLKSKPPTTWGVWLCIGWGCYAFSRFSAQFLLQSDHPVGDADLLYVMPLVFPILGFALLLCWDKLEAIIAAYFGIALATLVLTTHYAAIFRGETVRPLIQHNQIHGAVSCGLILIAAVFWITHYATHNNQPRFYSLYAKAAGPIIIALCLIGIYGAKSKGAWLALGCTFPILLFCLVGWLRTRTVALVLIVSTIVIIGVGLYAVRSNIQSTAGPTIDATIALEKKIATGAPFGPSVASTIGDRSTPLAMDERLQLWSNSWELFSSAPLFGLGSEWVVRWTHTHYTSVKYTMMHDGYLEILVRYGIVGMAIFVAMLFSFVRAIWQATKNRLVPRFALACYLMMTLFFVLTLLSNSNNRLPIGESFMLLSSTFAFACVLKNSAFLTENMSVQLTKDQVCAIPSAATQQASS